MSDMNWNRDWTRMFNPNKLPQQQKQGSMNWLNFGASAATGLLSFFDQKRREEDQHRRQKELMDKQNKQQRGLNVQGQELAMDMWNKTNYGAQMKHMKDAGLSPGLMYGMGGSGGTTSNAGSGGSAAGGTAAMSGPMDIANMLQAAMMKANIANVEAQTEKTNVETAKMAGVDTREGESRIDLNESAANLNRKTGELYDSNILVNENTISLNNQRIEGIKSDIQKNNSTIDVNESVIKLNEALGKLNDAQTQKVISDANLNAADLDWMANTGLNRNDSVVAKTVQYLSEQSGLTEKEVILLIGGSMAVKEIVKLIPKSYLEPAPGAKPVKGFGKGN